MTLRALRRSNTANKVVQKEFKSSDDPSSTADDLYFVNLVGMYVIHTCIYYVERLERKTIDV